MAEQESQLPAEPEVLWNGGPAAWTGSGVYIVAALVFVGGAVLAWWGRGNKALIIAAAAAMGIAIFVALWKFLDIAATRYRLTTDRLINARGLLTRRTDELELYRVKDAVLIEPFWMRLLRRGNVILYTSDKTTPTLVLYAIADAAKVRELIRTQVEATRSRKGVREVDVE